jgi:hypothetical protein
MNQLALVFLLLLASAGAASAQILEVGWDDAISRGGTQNRDFDCGSNAGSNTFVVTFRPPVDMLAVSEVDLTLAVQGGDLSVCDPFGGPPCPIPSLSPWWDFSTGSCRAGALQASADFLAEPWASSTTVEDPWGGVAYFHASPYQVQTVTDAAGTRTRGLQVLLIAPLGAMGRVDLLAGHEYYLARVTITNAHTIAPGGCEGCCQPTLVFPSQVQVTNDTNDFPVPFTANQQPLAWQSYNTSCSPVPARTHTWGALKSTYR